MNRNIIKKISYIFLFVAILNIALFSCIKIYADDLTDITGYDTDANSNDTSDWIENYTYTIEDSKVKLNTYTGNMSVTSITVYSKAKISGTDYDVDFVITPTGDKSDMPLAWWPSTITDVTFRGTYSDITDLSFLFYQLENLETVDLSRFTTSNATRMQKTFNGCTKLSSVDVSGLDVQNVRIFYDCFNGCTSLTSIDLSTWVTTNLDNIQGMFWGCTSLSEIELGTGFTIANATEIAYMFQGCEKLSTIDLSKFGTNKVENAVSVFSGCKALTTIDLSNFYSPNLISINYMFENCSSATSIDISNLETSNVTGMERVFVGCENLETLTFDVSKFKTTNAVNMQGIFEHCEKLSTLDLSGFDSDNKIENISNMFLYCKSLENINLDFSKFKTGNLTNMQSAFQGCEKLKNISFDNLDSNVNMTNIAHMFDGCSQIETIDIDFSKLDTSLVTSTDFMFYNCSNLTTLDLSGLTLTDNLTNTKCMFEGCSKLETVNLDSLKVNTTNVTDMDAMFYRCESLKTVGCGSEGTFDKDLFKSNKIENMANMFHNCYQLKTVDVSLMDFENLTTLVEFLHGDNSMNVTSVNFGNSDAPNLTTVGQMFSNCKYLQDVNINSLNPVNLTDMNRIFDCDDSIEKIDLSNWNCTKITNMDASFALTNNLKYLDISNIKCNNTSMNWLFNYGIGEGKLEYLCCTSSFIEKFTQVDNARLEKLKTLVINNDLTLSGSSYNTSGIFLEHSLGDDESCPLEIIVLNDATNEMGVTPTLKDYDYDTDKRVTSYLKVTNVNISPIGETGTFIDFTDGAKGLKIAKRDTDNKIVRDADGKVVGEEKYILNLYKQKGDSISPSDDTLIATKNNGDSLKFDLGEATSDTPGTYYGELISPDGSRKYASQTLVLLYHYKINRYFDNVDDYPLLPSQSYQPITSMTYTHSGYLNSGYYRENTYQNRLTKDTMSDYNPNIYLKWSKPFLASDTTEYTGTKFEPAVSFKINDTDTLDNLTKGTDYSLTYDTDSKNVGDYKVTVLGLATDDLSTKSLGSVELNYHITKRNVDTTKVSNMKLYYGDDEITPANKLTKETDGTNNVPTDKTLKIVYHVSQTNEDLIITGDFTYSANSYSNSCDIYAKNLSITDTNYQLTDLMTTNKITFASLGKITDGNYVPPEPDPTPSHRKKKQKTEVKDESKQDEEIKLIYNTSFIQGFDNSYRPNDELTRAEITSILSRICENYDEKTEYDVSNFVDIDVNDKKIWYKNYLGFVNEYGIMNGFDNYFRPNDKITRGEVVKILCRLLNIKVDESKDMKSVFTDLSNMWYKNYVLELSKLDIVNGYEDNTFRGDNPITRAEIAKIINNIINKDYKPNIKLVFNDIDIDDWYYEDILKASN